MAMCRWCDQNMSSLVVDSCTSKIVQFPDGITLDAIPYGKEEMFRCHDCNVAPGGYHHPGCDMERCPKCQGQRISCKCNKAPLSCNPVSDLIVYQSDELITLADGTHIEIETDMRNSPIGFIVTRGE